MKSYVRLTMSKAKKEGKNEGKKQFRLQRKWLGVLLVFVLSLGFARAYGIAKLGSDGGAKVQPRTTDIQVPPSRVGRPAPRVERTAESSAQKGFSRAKENNPPKIKVIPETYNFGKIPPEKISHTFSVENVGGSSLEIYHVSTSCGCTKASIDTKMIEPGETAKMVVNFEPALHRSFKKGEVVPMRRTIYIRSNDPGTPEKTIYITATVVEEGS